MGAQVEAEHGAGHEAAGEGEHHDDNSTLWKTINFVILAAAIGYGISKAGPAFFRSRTAEIQRGIAEATRLQEQAETHAAEMTRRLENLDAEIADLRREARAELEAEDRRIQASTAQLMARMQANAEQEIASAGKQARKELRAYSSELALELARQKIRSRMTPELANTMMDSFVRELGSGLQRVK
jgi:F-type H+-transporting ATPase subunit b